MSFLHRTMLLAIVGWVALAQPVAANEPGEAGALFLRVGMGARASAMGEAHVAVAQDASSLYWNPAAMAPVQGTNVSFMHNEYFETVRLEQISLTHETQWGTLGLGFTGLYMDKLERREDVPSAIPLGEFSVYDLAFSVGFARYIVPNTSLGVSVKPVYQKIDEEDAAGLAFDAGIYHVSRVEGVKMAAVVTNLGSEMQYDAETYTLPAQVKVGGSYEYLGEAIRGTVLVALDFVVPNDGDLKQHVGAEYNYDNRLSLRGGFKAGYDSHGATFGVGLRQRVMEFDVDFDYAMMLIGNDLGDSHRFGLSFSL